jgi:hypothetical protein
MFMLPYLIPLPPLSPHFLLLLTNLEHTDSPRLQNTKQISCIKLETVFSLKYSLLLNWRSQETNAAQMLKHETEPNGFLQLKFRWERCSGGTRCTVASSFGVPHNLKFYSVRTVVHFMLILGQLDALSPKKKKGWLVLYKDKIVLIHIFFNNMRALCGKFTVLTWCTQYCLLFRQRDPYQRNKTFSSFGDMVQIEPKYFLLYVNQRGTVYMELITSNQFHVNVYSVYLLISKKLITWNLLHPTSFMQMVSSVYDPPNGKAWIKEVCLTRLEKCNLYRNTQKVPTCVLCKILIPNAPCSVLM